MYNEISISGAFGYHNQFSVFHIAPLPHTLRMLTPTTAKYHQLRVWQTRHFTVTQVTNSFLLIKTCLRQSLSLTHVEISSSLCRYLLVFCDWINRHSELPNCNFGIMSLKLMNWEIEKHHTSRLAGFLLIFHI